MGFFDSDKRPVTKEEAYAALLNIVNSELALIDYNFFYNAFETSQTESVQSVQRRVKCKTLEGLIDFLEAEPVQLMINLNLRDNVSYDFKAKLLDLYGDLSYQGIELLELPGIGLLLAKLKEMLKELKDNPDSKTR